MVTGTCGISVATPSMFPKVRLCQLRDWADSPQERRIRVPSLSSFLGLAGTGMTTIKIED